MWVGRGASCSVHQPGNRHCLMTDDGQIDDRRLDQWERGYFRVRIVCCDFEKIGIFFCIWVCFRVLG